jgi:hypothetical protein
MSLDEGTWALGTKLTCTTIGKNIMYGHKGVEGRLLANQAQSMLSNIQFY